MHGEYTINGVGQSAKKQIPKNTTLVVTVPASVGNNLLQLVPRPGRLLHNI